MSKPIEFAEVRSSDPVEMVKGFALSVRSVRARVSMHVAVMSHHDAYGLAAAMGWVLMSCSFAPDGRVVDNKRWQALHALAVSYAVLSVNGMAEGATPEDQIALNVEPLADEHLNALVRLAELCRPLADMARRMGEP